MSMPKQRSQLVLEDMGEETLVYCGESKKAFCLNPLCARVFRLCDGTRSLAGLAAELGLEQGDVENSLAVLQEHALLEPLEAVRRRDFLKGAAILVPAVLAVAAPEPSMAASVAGGCVTGAQCAAMSAPVNSCQPCDPGATPVCNDPISFCMSVWRVATTNSSDPDAPVVPGSTCANDSWAGTPGFSLNGCENANLNNIWAMDCDAARGAVIAMKLPGQFISNYKCCHCVGR